MSGPKFTPGPWEAEDRGDRIAIHQPDNAPIWLGEVTSIELSDLDDMQDATARANARLIAAAPDLYVALAHTEGALSALVKDIEAMTDWTHRSLGIERKAMFAKILSEARAALAKAEGR